MFFIVGHWKFKCAPLQNSQDSMKVEAAFVVAALLFCAGIFDRGRVDLGLYGCVVTVIVGVAGSQFSRIWHLFFKKLIVAFYRGSSPRF